jgi:hypothetical protein
MSDLTYLRYTLSVGSDLIGLNVLDTSDTIFCQRFILNINDI